MARMDALSKVLIKKRLEKNLSMKKAAEEIGISYVSLWRIETKCCTAINYATVGKLAKFLGMSEKAVRDLI